MAQTGGGVRSLLARFENNNANTNSNNNNSTSPPSRGRSPIGSEHSAASRPLSKVRASFVAVERGNSNAGQQSVSTSPFLRDSPAKPRTVTGADDAGSPIQRSVGLASTGDGNGNNGALNERMLSSPRPTLSRNKSTGGDSTTSAPSGEVVQELGKILKGSPFEDSVPAAGRLSDSKQTSPPVSNTEKLQKDVSTTNGKPRESTFPKKTTTTSTKPASARVSNVFGVQDSPAQKQAQARDKSPAKDQKPSAFPWTPKTQSDSTNNIASKPAAAKPTKEPDKLQPKVAKKQPSRASLNPITKPPSSRPIPSRDTATTKPAASNTNHTKPPTDHKPRTKSPTRPARLPSSLMTPTASSAAKLNPNPGHPNPPSRPGSRNTNITASSRTITRKPSSLKPDQSSNNNNNIRKQPSRSTLAAPRPSSAATQDRPRSRISNVSNSTRAPDESFLARMMRPTASSANKAHDKLEIKSPPRPTANANAKKSINKGTPRSSMGSRRTNHTDSPAKSVVTEGSGSPISNTNANAEAKPESVPAAQVEENVPVSVEELSSDPVPEEGQGEGEEQAQGELSVVEEAPVAVTPIADGGPDAENA